MNYMFSNHKFAYNHILQIKVLQSLQDNAYFKVPQHNAAVYCDKYKNHYNVGKMRLKSTACYGTTMFWMVRSLENSTTEHNGKEDGK
jgi:hypothetical protein